MPNIKIESGQVIVLTLKEETSYCFLCDQMVGNVVIFFYQRDSRRLTIANCDAKVRDNEFDLLTYGGVTRIPQPTNYSLDLICGSKSDKQIIESFCVFLDIYELNFDVKSNFHNLCIEHEKDGMFKYQANVPKLEFVPAGDERIVNQLERWSDISDGLISSFLPMIDADSAHVNEINSGVDSSDIPSSSEIVAIESPQSDDASDELLKKALEKSKKLFEPNQSTIRRFARLTRSINALEIYSVPAWQTAIINMASGRKIKLKLYEMECALVIFYGPTQIAAVSVLGKDADKKLIELTIDRCIGSLLALASKYQTDSKNNSFKFTYQLIAPENCPQGTIMRKQFDNMKDGLKKKGESAAIKKILFEEAKFGMDKEKNRLYCPYKESILEVSKDKLDILDFSNRSNFGLAYHEIAIHCTAKKLAETKQLDKHDPERMRYKDFFSVVDIPVVHELMSDYMLEVDLLKDKCILKLEDKSIVVASYCEHTGKFAVLQIATNNFKTYFLNEQLTVGNYMMLDFMANSPEMEGAAPTKLFLWCKKPKLGHASDSKICDAYVENFALNYKHFCEKSKGVFTSREGTKYERHPLALTLDMKYYEEGDIGNFMCISLEGTKLKREFKSGNKLNFGDDPIVYKPPPESAMQRYRERGLKVMQSYMSGNLYTQERPGMARKPPQGTGTQPPQGTGTQSAPRPKTPRPMEKPG